MADQIGEGTPEDREIGEGTHEVVLRCPRCKLAVLSLIHVQAVLTVPAEENATLRAKVATKAVEHQCGQGDLWSDLEAADAQPP
jgi:hypothetical protein